MNVQKQISKVTTALETHWQKNRWISSRKGERKINSWITLVGTGFISLNYRQFKKSVFWDVTPCGSCKNRRFGGAWRLLYQGDKNR
jgi:hypothetical protein